MSRWIFQKTWIPVLIAAIALPALAAPKGSKRLPGESVTKTGSIDWDRGVLYATGMGAISLKEPNQAKAYLRARGFALQDAYRNLLTVVKHVKIDSKTVGADFEVINDRVITEVKGKLKGAQIVGERQIKMGNSTLIEVTVGTPLYGEKGISSIFLPEVIRQNRIALEKEEEAERVAAKEPVRREEAPKVVLTPPREKPVEDAPRPADTTFEESGTVRYTSLIVDARGCGLERAMCPKIMFPDGGEVWGTVSVDADWAIENGFVAYAHSVEQARRHLRAGVRPLVVRAIGRSGGKFNCDAVVSEEDGRRIMEANARDGFLNKFRVIFVVDAGR